MAAFEMFDLKEKGFFALFDANKKFFDHSKNLNWFYLKNDKNSSNRPNCIWAGTTNRHCNDNDGPSDGNSAAFLYSTLPIEDSIRDVCGKSDNGLIDFQLIDCKTEAYLGIIDVDGKETIALFICNEPQTIDLTFSKNGKTKYEDAKSEEGSLPWLVESDIILKLLPENIRSLIVPEKQDGRSI